MLDPKAVHRLLVHLEAAGLLYPASGEDVAEARLRMWSVAMNVDGVSEPEATYAAMLVSRRPQSDRPRVIAPGDLLEAIYSERMKLQRSALALPRAPKCFLKSAALGFGCVAGAPGSSPQYARHDGRTRVAHATHAVRPAARACPLTSGVSWPAISPPGADPAPFRAS